MIRGVTGRTENDGRQDLNNVESANNHTICLINEIVFNLKTEFPFKAQRIATVLISALIEVLRPKYVFVYLVLAGLDQLELSLIYYVKHPMFRDSAP